jgi:hypothetical protein
METDPRIVPERVYTLPPRRTDAYRPLGESGPAGQLEGRERVTVVLEGKLFGTIEIEHLLIDRIYRAVKLTAVGPSSPGYIDFESLRRTNLRTWTRRALAGNVRAVTPHGTYTADSSLSNPDPLWAVALTYVTARATGDNPTAAVAEDFGLTHSAAAQRVKRARDKGYLPPTTPGKVT